LLSAIETCKEYKNILLCYPFIVFTDHKNNTFNGLKASDHVLSWLLLLEEYGVTFEYLTGKKSVSAVADALSRLDIDSLKIQEEEVLTLLLESANNSISNIKFPMHTALIFKEQEKVKKQWLGTSNLPGERLYIDISSIKERSFGGAKFWALIVDDYSDYCWSFVMKNKSDLKTRIKTLLTDLKIAN
jgi:hypothetical protein